MCVFKFRNQQALNSLNFNYLLVVNYDDNLHDYSVKSWSCDRLWHLDVGINHEIYLMEPHGLITVVSPPCLSQNLLPPLHRP